MFALTLGQELHVNISVFARKTNIFGSCLKGDLGQFTDLRLGEGGLAKKEGVEFLRRGDIPQCPLRH